MNAALAALPLKVTLEALEARVASTEYLLMSDGRTTICQLTMVNGFTVRGESSAATVENFNAALGRDYARQAALDKAWGFEGYLLVERRHAASLQPRAKVKVCGVDCFPGRPACNGYCTGESDNPPLVDPA